MRTLRKKDIESMEKELSVLQNPNKILGGCGVCNLMKENPWMWQFVSMIDGGMLKEVVVTAPAPDSNQTRDLLEGIRQDFDAIILDYFQGESTTGDPYPNTGSITCGYWTFIGGSLVFVDTGGGNTGGGGGTGGFPYTGGTSDSGGTGSYWEYVTGNEFGAWWFGCFNGGDSGNWNNWSWNWNWSSDGLYSGLSTPNLPPELFDLWSPLNDNLKQLILDLQIQITYDPTLGVGAQYYPDTHTIVISDLASSYLYAELVHAEQDKLGILGDRANNEFQEHVIDDLLSLAGIANAGSPAVAGDNYINWLLNVMIPGTGLNYGHVDRAAFAQGFQQYYEDWLQQYSGKPYGEGNNPNYNWQWDTFFDTFGI